MTLAVDLEEVRLLDLITIIQQSRPGTDQYDRAVSELMRWMRPRALAFLGRKIPPDSRTQQALRDGIDGFLWEFVTRDNLKGYSAYSRRLEGIGDEPIGLRAYLFGGRRTIFFSFFRSQVAEGAFGATAQRAEKVREALRKALLRMRHSGELADYIRVAIEPNGERWMRTETLNIPRDANFSDVRVLRSDHAQWKPQVDLGNAERAREERFIDLARNGSSAGPWRKFVLRTFDRFDVPLLMTTLIRAAQAMTAESTTDADEVSDPNSLEGDPL